MLRIFVTGDNHIGLKYASHEKAAVLASARMEAFKGMVETANEENCALFAITGDLFENTYGVSKKEIKALLDALSCFRGIVAVLPGNHENRVYKSDGLDITEIMCRTARILSLIGSKIFTHIFNCSIG